MHPSLEKPLLRTCKRCNTEKEFTQFTKHPACRYGITHTCITCKNKQSEQWHLDNSERRSELAQIRYKKRKQFSGNWEVYFKYLLHKPKHDSLTISDLMFLLKKQNGKCALSGQILTAQLAHGKVHTNASLDRIQAGGPYTKENVRLVCSIVNSMRLNLSDEALFFWCSSILNTTVGEMVNETKLAPDDAVSDVLLLSDPSPDGSVGEEEQGVYPQA